MIDENNENDMTAFLQAWQPKRIKNSNRKRFQLWKPKYIKNPEYDPEATVGIDIVKGNEKQTQFERLYMGEPWVDPDIKHDLRIVETVIKKGDIK